MGRGEGRLAGPTVSTLCNPNLIGRLRTHPSPISTTRTMPRQYRWIPPDRHRHQPNTAHSLASRFQPVHRSRSPPSPCATPQQEKKRKPKENRSHNTNQKPQAPANQTTTARQAPANQTTPARPEPQPTKPRHNPTARQPPPPHDRNSRPLTISTAAQRHQQIFQ